MVHNSKDCSVLNMVVTSYQVALSIAHGMESAAYHAKALQGGTQSKEVGVGRLKNATNVVDLLTDPHIVLTMPRL